MTFITAAAAYESAKASLESARAALMSAVDGERFNSAGTRRAGRVNTANGTYSVTTDAAGAAHVVETLPA